MQRIEAVKQADDKGGDDQHHGRDIVRRLNCSSTAHRIEQKRAAPTSWQMNRRNEGTKQNDASNDQRRDVGRPVLP